MNSLEWRATSGLSLIYALRMLGMFMILPVFALYAVDLPGGATPMQIGLAIGIYGLTQASLQIPFGMWSDRIGRKPVIVGGMLVFAAGSVVAWLAPGIEGIIIGRALQGAGAVASSVTALLADSTREQVRTQAMTVLGIGMGVSFGVAMVLGPVVAGLSGVQEIFLLTAILALAAVPLVLFYVPPQPARHQDIYAGHFRQVLADRELLRLDAGIFLLHAMLTSMFVAMPLAIDATLNLPRDLHWWVYLPVLLVSGALVFPFIRWAEQRGRSAQAFTGAIGILALSLLVATLLNSSAGGLLTALLLFFIAFNFLEGSLPSMISRRAPAAHKGAALGTYSTSQFLGNFAGGLLGGWALGFGGVALVFGAGMLLPLVWLGLSGRWRVSPPTLQ